MTDLYKTRPPCNPHQKVPCIYLLIKKVIIIVAIQFFITESLLQAQSVDGIHVPFKIWLMNNENRLLTQLAADRHLLDAMSMGNGMLLAPRPSWPKPENQLWRVHLKIYAYLSEANEIYQKARQFGSGKLAKIINSVYPGEWATFVFGGLPTFHACRIAAAINALCGKSYLAVLGLDQSRDADLSARLDQAARKLSDSERRLLNNYLENFMALYPKNNTTRRLYTFLRSGLGKQFAKGVATLLSAKPSSGNQGSTALLAELEAITSGENASSAVDTALLSPEALPEELGISSGTAEAVNGTGSATSQKSGSDTSDLEASPQVDIFNVLGPEENTNSKTR